MTQETPTPAPTAKTDEADLTGGIKKTPGDIVIDIKNVMTDELDEVNSILETALICLRDLLEDFPARFKKHDRNRIRIEARLIAIMTILDDVKVRLDLMTGQDTFDEDRYFACYDELREWFNAMKKRDRDGDR